MAITSHQQLPEPQSIAVITMELQRGVIGDLSTMESLQTVVNQDSTLERCGQICTAARSHGIPVVHAQAAWRADRRGTHLASPIENQLAQRHEQILLGTPAVEAIPELGDTSNDLFSIRSHGMSPWIGTNLDSLIRSLQVTSIVAIGVSLNIGLFGLCLNAVDHGYKVVLPVDATAGVPREYATDVIKYSLGALTTLTTTEKLLESWDHPSQ